MASRKRKRLSVWGILAGLGQNRRLGHRPSSREIDKYVNWLALDGRQPKRRFQEHQVAQFKQEIDELKSREKLSLQRQGSLQEQLDGLRDEVDAVNRLMHEQFVKWRRQYVVTKTV